MHCCLEVLPIGRIQASLEFCLDSSKVEVMQYSTGRRDLKDAGEKKKKSQPILIKSYYETLVHLVEWL